MAGFDGMEPFVTLGISLGLGMLIGLQRERTERQLGGIRTFPLISLLGTFCGMLAVSHGAWILAAGFLVTFGVLAISNFLQAGKPEIETGQTTEVAALLTYAIGAYLVEGNRAAAIAGGGVVVLLLHAKEPMHSFVEKMGRKDIEAIMQFVVISLIILPLLPDRNYGPFKVLNPFDIWRMVALIVGISLAGYVVYKLLGSRAGTLLGGVLGGMISSTATTVSYARRAKDSVKAHKLAVTAILIASAIAYVRVIVEVTVVAPRSAGALVLPFAAVLVWVALVAAASYLFHREKTEEIPPSENPAELKSAVIFGLIYAVVLVAVASAKHYFGSAGLYGVALISGLTDMDAITLSISRMVEAGTIGASAGWKLIMIASLANLVFKGVAAGVLGGWRFGVRLGGFFAVIAAGAILLIWLWPEGWALRGMPREPAQAG